MTSLEDALTRTGDPRNYVIGEVKAIDAVAQRVTVLVHGGETYLPTAGGAYSVGDLVLVGRFPKSPWWVLAPVGTAPTVAPDAPPPPPVAPPPPDVYRTVSIVPRATYTYRSSWRTDTHDLYQGDWTGRGRNTGVAFYGSAVKGLKADTAADGNRIVLRYKRLEGGSFAATAPTFWTVAQSTKPGGAPTLLSSFSGTAVKQGKVVDTLVLPDARAAELLSGAAGGIACFVNADSPYVQLAGRSSYSAAMSLSVRYTR